MTALSTTSSCVIRPPRIQKISLERNVVIGRGEARSFSRRILLQLPDDVLVELALERLEALEHEDRIVIDLDRVLERSKRLGPRTRAEVPPLLRVPVGVGHHRRRSPVAVARRRAAE